jgi:hypothetical protein
MPKVYLFSHRLREIEVTEDNFSELIASGDIIPINGSKSTNDCVFHTNLNQLNEKNQ